MFLLKIVNKSVFLAKLTSHSYVGCLFYSVQSLNFIKKETFSFFIRWLFLYIFINSFKFKTRINHFNRYIYVSFYQNQKLMNYIVNINQSETNTLINLNDIKGNPKLFYSAGMLNLQRKEKIRQPKVTILLLRALLSKSKIFKCKPAALHFSRLFFGYQSYIFKKLKQRIFIKLVISYNHNSHNGCRLKKRKRIKIRTKAKNLEEMTEGLKVADCKSAKLYLS